MYGTDIGARCVLAENAEDALNKEECIARMVLIDGMFDEKTLEIIKRLEEHIINKNINRIINN